MTKTDCYTFEGVFWSSGNSDFHCGLSSLDSCPKEKETGIFYRFYVKTVDEKDISNCGRVNESMKKIRIDLLLRFRERGDG